MFLLPQQHLPHCRSRIAGDEARKDSVRLQTAIAASRLLQWVVADRSYVLRGNASRDSLRYRAQG